MSTNANQRLVMQLEQFLMQAKRELSITTQNLENNEGREDWTTIKEFCRAYPFFQTTLIHRIIDEPNFPRDEYSYLRGNPKGRQSRVFDAKRVIYFFLYETKNFSTTRKNINLLRPYHEELDKFLRECEEAYAPR